MLFGPKFLKDDAIIAVIDTAMATLGMETERLNYPALCFDKRLVPTEAFYRGLLEGFTIGVMNSRGLVKVNSGTNINFTSRSRRIFDDAIERACLYGASIGTHTAFFWSTCYGLSKLEISRELFSRRLQSSIFQETEIYEIGKQDALYQSSIAHTGMLEPTRKFERFLRNSEKN